MDEAEESSVNFLYKTMLTRDPRKRQVKPVQHGMLMDFPELDDSDEDDDYKLPTQKDSSDEEEGSASEAESSGAGSQSDVESEGATSADAASILTVGDLISMSQKRETPTSLLSEEPTMDTLLSVSSMDTKPVRVSICAVCLEDFSEGNDEIVECDGCGVAVHEACYGISDSISVASTESSASTEPWFCDACKAGIKPNCELCPNTGGIYKETDAGRWVHLVCALFVPGVAFGDVDNLKACTLFEMPYTKYGAKECSLCEDPLFSRTGVCISCDAGMCRLNFHVTCAQREGLLSEASPDVEIADPFYAHCKQHAEKLAMRIKRRNFLAMQSRMRVFSDEQNALQENERERITRKLKRHRRKYKEAKNNRPPNWVPQTKMPRPLTTSASAMKRLMKKAELLGVSAQNEEADGHTDPRRKRHHALAFTPDYVRYYLDRGHRIDACRRQERELQVQKTELQREETQLRTQYDQIRRSVNALRCHYDKQQSSAQELWNNLAALTPKTLYKPLFLEPQKREKEVKVANHNAGSPAKVPTIIHKCATCGGSHDAHLLAHCDTCHLHYHLSCLVPPLTRMPKKTRLYGWQCSACMSDSSSGSEKQVDVSAPMRLRTNINQPHKFRQQIELPPSRRKSRKKRRRSTPKKSTEDTDQVNEGAGKKKRLTDSQKRSKDPPQINRCSVCDRESLPSQLVRCDKCDKHFHFVCLDPPRKSSPRVRGYAWHCDGCASNSENEEDDEKGDEKVKEMPAKEVTTV